MQTDNLVEAMQAVGTAVANVSIEITNAFERMQTFLNSNDFIFQIHPELRERWARKSRHYKRYVKMMERMKNGR